jgi:hypothetical protein
MLPSFVCLHEFDPKTSQLMSVCGSSKSFTVAELFVMMHQSYMFLDLYVDIVYSLSVFELYCEKTITASRKFL